MRPRQYLKQRFAPRQYPMLIVIDEHEIVGPFCVHCGNPEFMHGPDSRCPNRHLHPLLPPPNLPFRDEAGVSREARQLLRRLRARKATTGSIIADTLDADLLRELRDAGYVRQQGPWVEAT